MARTGSTTRAPRKTAAQKAAEAAEANQTSVVETDGTTEPATEADTTEAIEEATPVSTDTVEAEVEETVASDTTEATTESETDDKAAAEKALAEQQGKFDEFKAVVQTALAERDQSTGTLPEAQVEAVKVAYRELAGAKWKNQAKAHLNNDLLRAAVNDQDIVRGQAVMSLSDALASAGSAPKSAAERKPADPAEAYRQRLVILNLAYRLAYNDVPEGVDAAAERGKVETQVTDLTESAEKYVAWMHNDAEDKGDAPEVDPIVIKAVKAAQGKAASASRSAGSATPRQSDGTRRNVRTHIAQVFADKEAGTVLKVSEIAKAVTEEYPDGSCSPGAISAALKSERGVEGFELVTDQGPAAARKL